MTTTSTAWPPSVDDTTQWRTIQVGRGYDREIVKVRPVQLWGAEVFINEEDMVLCDGCLEFLTVDRLTVPGTGHRVAIDNIKRPA
jgi:hypothetical protein